MPIEEKKIFEDLRLSSDFNGEWKILRKRVSREESDY